MFSSCLLLQIYHLDVDYLLGSLSLLLQLLNDGVLLHDLLLVSLCLLLHLFNVVVLYLT